MMCIMNIVSIVTKVDERICDTITDMKLQKN